MLTPGVRGNAGCYRPFTVKAPEGSILNCTKPVAVNMRTRTGWYLAPNIFRALSEAVPDKVQAFTGLPVASVIYGSDENGRIYSDHLFMGGGQGASAHGDGKSGLLYPTSAANTSIELLETRAPVLVLEKAFLADSGGAGRQRGGLGMRVRYRKLRDDGRETLGTVYPEGVSMASQGLFGGGAGGEARGVVRNPAGEVVKDCRTGALATLNTTEEIVEIVLAGGSGYGDPLERPLAAVAGDLEDGYVTPEGAARDYGVVLPEEGRIDTAASSERRRTATHEAAE
jgi:5-oxoprolinase (ATP-hydrolysing)